VSDEFELDLRAVFNSSVRLWVLRIRVDLHLGISGVVYRDVPFRLDSATDITHIPRAILPPDFAAGPHRRFRSASGTDVGAEIEFAFSFQKLPLWTFPSVGVVNERLSHGLLAPRDVLGRFHLLTRGTVDVPTERHMNVVVRTGRLAMRLRDGHDGVRIPPRAGG
jgi:hypothetical protein